jgi:hypothetical protein
MYVEVHKEVDGFRENVDGHCFNYEGWDVAKVLMLFSQASQCPSGAAGCLPDPRLRFVWQRVFGLGNTGLTCKPSDGCMKQAMRL